MTPAERNKAAWLLLAGMLVTLGLATRAYWPGLSGAFMLDDGPNIVLAYISNPDWDAIVYAIAHNGSGVLGRSVSMLSFVLTGMEFGLDPWGYKYHNLMLHLLNGVLLFRFLQILLPLLDHGLGERRALLIAGVTTALWLVHPLLVSTVLYAVQRMTQLAALFTLLALLAYIKARMECGDRVKLFIYGWVVLPAMMLLALLSKETGVLIPLYLLLIEVLAFRTRPRELRASPRLALFSGTFILLPLVLGTVLLILKFDLIVDFSTRTFTLHERLLTQLHVVAFYVRLIVLPRIREMSLFQDDYPVTTGFDALTLLLLVALAGVIFLAWRLRTKWPVLSFGLAWFIVSHLLESTFLPLELVFEHRNYLAACGLLLLPVYGAFRFESLGLLRYLCPVFFATFAFMTATRAEEWGDRDLFHEIAVQEHPQSGRALNTYVNYLTGRGEYEKSIEYLERLVALSPTELGAVLHIQVAKCAARLRDDTVLGRAVELARQYPISVYAHNALQNLLMLVGDRKCPGVSLDDVEALVDAALAFEGLDKTSDGYAHLMRLHGIIGMFEGRYAQGYSDFRTAHEITGNITTLHELVRYQLVAGRIQDAEETFVLMEQQDARRMGLDRYQVERTRELLEEGKNTARVRTTEPPAAPQDASAVQTAQ